MRVARILCVTFALAAIGPASTAQAGPSQADNPELQELNEQLLELKRQMDEMQRKHDQQINALRTEIETLRQAAPGPAEAPAEDEAAALRAMAESLAGEKKEEKPPGETVFKFSGLSLQKLNPEISVAGDFIAQYRGQSGTRQRSNAAMRGLELNFQSYLDPYSRMKATTHISEEGIHLEEAYFTRFSLFDAANLDVGKFRQQFGVVNRWHEDAIDQVQYPLALRNILGEEGLSQTGASVDWTLPTWGSSHQGLTCQVTAPESDHLFGGDSLGNPSFLVHYKNYRDLSRDTYLEFGLTGLFGWNDAWDVNQGGTFVTQYDARGTQVYGADISLLWEPADRALYRNFEWRTEFYLLNQDILAPDNSGRDQLNAWGAYSYVQGKVARNLILGIRADYYQPDSKGYATVTAANAVTGLPETVTISPLAYASNDPHRWQICPYITWWQSEWVKFRAEYDYGWGQGISNPEHVLWFQANFAAGPHKHERY